MELRKRLCSLVLSALVFSSQGAAVAFCAEDSPTELMEQVVSLIERNNSSIHSLEAELSETKLDSTVTEAVDKKQKDARGRETTVFLRPKIVTKSRIWIAGDALKCSTELDESSDLPLGFENIVVIKARVITDYRPSLKIVWINDPEGAGGQQPINPMDAASPSIVYNVVEFLRKCKVIRAEMRNDAQGGSVVSATLKGPVGGVGEYEFSSANSYLPKQILFFYPDGTLNQELLFSYTPVLENRSFILAKKRHRYFPKGVTKRPQDMGWNQQQDLVLSDVQLNQPIPSKEFQLDIPAGVSIRDTINKRIRISIGGPIN
jgi:outer membrane lipoprotein-sorting protein